MIRVTFFADSGRVRGFEAKGHAGYARPGKDIVCAAVSAVLLTALNGLVELIGAPCMVIREDERGYLMVRLSRDLQENTAHDAGLILGVAMAGIQSIAKDYPGYVDVRNKDTEVIQS